VYDLDFPTDVKEVVKNQYRNAKIQVRLPQGGHTDQNPVDRWTM